MRITSIATLILHHLVSRFELKRLHCLSSFVCWGFIIAVCWPCIAWSGARSELDLRTEAEQSGWLKTGRYAEVQRLCHEFPKAFPGRVRCETFGLSAEGRPLLALIAGPAMTAKSNSQAMPVILLQGGIHAGEIDGKDAGLVFLREVLQGKRLAGALQQLTLVFVPVLNVDGHERFGAHNRPNQNGPEQSGWRTTAQNYNLNRDYLKVDAPETRAILALLNRFDPLAYVDLHVTDGARFRHDIAVLFEPLLAGPEGLKSLAFQAKQELMQALQKTGHRPLWFYPSFDREDDPQSGLSTQPQAGRFSNGYWALRNRLGILVETHSWNSYAERCQATLDALQGLVESALLHHKAWREAADKADQEDQNLAGKMVDLAYKNTESAVTIDFLGYQYSRTLSSVSGQLMTRYDPNKPAIWSIPLRKEVVVDIARPAPAEGYIVPAAYRELLLPRLKAHAVVFQQIGREQTVEAEEYRLTHHRLSANSYEKHQRLEHDGRWSRASMKVGSGALFIPIAQTRARLIMQIFEPASRESYLGWGFFNEILESKEYMEPYLAEAVAEEMLKDPIVKQAFERRLAEDPEFAASPSERLDFFYQRHPSFDERLFRYPVLRALSRPKL